MANSVTIVLNAIDQASAVVNRLMSNIDNGLTKSLSRATLAGNLMTSGLQAGLNALNSVSIKTNQLFNEAVQTQTNAIATSGNIAKIAGYNFQQATSFVEDFQKEMAKVAKDLPGVTEDFAAVGRGIMDDVIPAFAGLDGKLDAIERKAALESLKELSTWGTLLGKIGNSTPQDTAKDMSNFISKSAGLGELFANNFFQNNPTVRKSIIKQLTGDENTPLRDATAIYKTKSSDELRQILIKSLQQDKEVIDALTNSVDGVFGMITDSLFGLYTGTFGLLRDLDSNAEGNQSALRSINTSLLELFGPEGLFVTLDKTFNKLGLKFIDPMKLLSDTANSFSSWVKNLKDKLNEFIKYGDLSQIASLFTFRGLGERLASVINNIFKYLNQVNWWEVFGFVGTRLAELVNEALDYLFKLDYTQIIETISKMTVGLLNGIFQLLTRIDWLKPVAIIVKIITSALVGIVKSIFDAVLNVVKEVISLITAPIEFVLNLLGRFISDTFEVIYKIWDGISRAIFSSLDTLKDTLVNFFREVIVAIPSLKDIIKNDVNVNGTVTNSDTTGGNINPNNRTTETHNDDPLGEISPLRFMYSIFSKVGEFFQGNKADGQNVSSFLSSVNNERNKAPFGSDLVIANTSEVILNRQQQSALLGRISGGSSLNIGNLNIYTQAKDPEGIAKDVVKYITREWQNYSQNNLATAAS